MLLCPQETDAEGEQAVNRLRMRCPYTEDNILICFRQDCSGYCLLSGRVRTTPNTGAALEAQRESRQYLVSRPIVAWYYTQLIGDARRPPTIIAAANFVGIAVIGILYFFDPGCTGSPECK